MSKHIFSFFCINLPTCIRRALLRGTSVHYFSLPISAFMQELRPKDAVQKLNDTNGGISKCVPTCLQQTPSTKRNFRHGKTAPMQVRQHVPPPPRPRLRHVIATIPRFRVSNSSPSSSSNSRDNALSEPLSVFGTVRQGVPRPKSKVHTQVRHGSRLCLGSARTILQLGFLFLKVSTSPWNPVLATGSVSRHW